MPACESLVQYFLKALLGQTWWLERSALCITGHREVLCPVVVHNIAACSSLSGDCSYMAKA